MLCIFYGSLSVATLLLIGYLSLYSPYVFCIPPRHKKAKKCPLHSFPRKIFLIIICNDLISNYFEATAYCVFFIFFAFYLLSAIFSDCRSLLLARIFSFHCRLMIVYQIHETWSCDIICGISVKVYIYIYILYYIILWHVYIITYI